MSKKAKRILIISGIGIDVAITIFLFIVAIIMLATMPAGHANMSRVEFEHQASLNGPFIGYLQTHSTVYFWVGLFPLFALLALNIVILILYVRKVGKKPEVAVDDLSEEQKAALRAELLKELQGESEKAKKEEKSE